MVTLNGDCFISLSGWVDSLQDLVRLWIALGCTLPANHCMWKEMLREHCLMSRGGQDLNDVIMRLGCRLDSGGLLLIERMYVLRKCSSSGCFNQFREIDNTKDTCAFHPGILRKGRLSCCREDSFRAMGCKAGYHKGALHESVFMRREAELEQQQQQDVEKKDEKKGATYDTLADTKKPIMHSEDSLDRKAASKEGSKGEMT
jgi:hypothetical protein